ncbi:MAG: hypothetical protein AAFP19_11370 [Bacteroidota bacterium]
MDLNQIFNRIERGKQQGKTYSFEQDGETIWSSVAIQKWEGRYKVYIDEIRASKMDAEEYQKELTVSFDTLKEAAAFIAAETRIEFHELSPCKGQTIFNPQFD